MMQGTAAAVIVVASFLVVALVAGQNDQTIQPGARGAGVVEATCSRIETSCVLTEDKLMTRRLAFVESSDGNDPNTFRTGYYGGIWQVDRAMFDATKTSAALSSLGQAITNIRNAFEIDWTTVIWDDLTKPLHSALGARLYIQYNSNNISIPRSIDDQATFWKTYYRPSRDVNEYVTEANQIEEKNEVPGQGYNCDDRNPCTPENAAAGKFHFPHDDPSKFVQCSEWGQCYIMNCSQGLVWDVAANTCNYPGAGYNCDDRNPCTPENAAAGKFQFPHDDPSKYVLCTESDNESEQCCFVKSCKIGQVWDVEANACGPGAVSTTKGPTTTPTTTRATTPTTTIETEVPGEGYNCDDRNPCTPENAAAGKFHFPHDDPSKYVLCGVKYGSESEFCCFVESCSIGEVWYVEANACGPGAVSTTKAPTTTPTTTRATTPTTTIVTEVPGEGYNCDDRNPCTPENAAAGKFHFPHDDPSKFVQCDEWGQCFVKDCQPGLVWDVAANACNWP